MAATHLTTFELPPLETLLAFAAKRDGAWAVRFEKLRAALPQHQHGYYLFLRARFETPQAYAAHLMSALEQVADLRAHQNIDLVPAVEKLEAKGDAATPWAPAYMGASMAIAVDFAKTMQEFGLFRSFESQQGYELVLLALKILPEKAEPPQNKNNYILPLHYCLDQLDVKKPLQALAHALTSYGRDEKTWMERITRFREGSEGPFTDNGGYTPLADALADRLNMDVAVLFPPEFRDPMNLLGYEHHWNVLLHKRNDDKQAFILAQQSAAEQQPAAPVTVPVPAPVPAEKPAEAKTPPQGDAKEPGAAEKSAPENSAFENSAMESLRRANALADEATRISKAEKAARRGKAGHKAAQDDSVLALQQALSDGAGEVTGKAAGGKKDGTPTNDTAPPAEPKNKIGVEKIAPTSKGVGPVNPFPNCPIPSVAEALAKIPLLPGEERNPGWFAGRARANGVKVEDFRGPYEVVMGRAKLNENIHALKGPSNNLQALAAIVGNDVTADELAKEWGRHSGEDIVPKPAPEAPPKAQRTTRFRGTRRLDDLK